MAERYGLWPGVVAVVGDADMYCVTCAKARYGELAVQAVIDGVPGCEQYRDREGNALGVVLYGSEDLHGQSCGACFGRLCEEECSCYQDSELWEHYAQVESSGRWEQGEVLLTRLGQSEPCSVDGCGQAAYWSWKQGDVRHVVCFACMRRMSAMNSENAAFFADVLRWGVPGECQGTGDA